MSKKQDNNGLSTIQRMQGYIAQTENLLKQMQLPVNEANPETMLKLETELKNNIRNWINATNEALIRNMNGEPNGFKSDGTGVLTGNTDFSQPIIRKKYRHAHRVDELIREILDEQKNQTELSISPSELISQVTNDSEKQIEIPMDSGEHVSIDKESGDTTVTDKNGVKKTFKGHFGGVASFAKGILNWLLAKFVAFKNWVVNLFKIPKDEDILDSIVTS